MDSNFQFLGWNHIYSSKIVQDYLNWEPNIHPFFPGHYSNNQDWETIIQARLEFFNTRRTDFVNSLSEILFPSLSEAQTQARSLLEKNNTICIMTGQQAGLLGGPLFTLTKTLSAIRWARHLSQIFPQYHFVPMFWVEHEDHDFSEINKISLPEKNRFKLDLLADAYQQVKFIRIPDQFSDWISSLSEQLPQTEFKQNIIAQVMDAYQSSTFGFGFGALMNQWFSSLGLLVVDGGADKLKQLGNYVFETEIKENAGLHGCNHTIDQLQARGYPIQVNPKDVNLFSVSGGKRLAFEQSEPLDPAKLSPNVITRPILQDYVFPTVGYVAGPGEMNYFAEYGEVYKRFRIPQPMIIPRHFTLIIEPGIARLLQKTGLTPDDILVGNSSEKDFIQSKSSIDTDQLMDLVKTDLEVIFQKYKKEIAVIDLPMAESWQGLLGRFLPQLDQFSSRLNKTLKQQNETLLTQYQRLHHHLLPHQVLQEREISGIYFLIKYGPELLNFLLGKMNVDQLFLTININEG